MDERAKKTLLRLVPYGLYAVAAGTVDAPSAMTVNWLTQTAFEPPMLAVAMEVDSRTLGVVRERGLFTVSLFDAGQRELAGQLGRRSAKAPDKLAGIAFVATYAGSVALAESLGHLECRVTGELPSGDHVLVLAEVLEAVALREGAALSMRDAGFRYSG
jgi:flavin reductase (DIM6/NTAB) family NADH-FMN oxidoreductase RutF